jgi:hypothetical protein
MGSLDPRKSLTRTTRGRAGRPSLIRLLTDKAFNATTPTNMAIAPPAWEQHLCLILLFIAYPRVGGENGCHYSCHVEHCSTIDVPLNHKMTTTAPGFSGARYYSFLVDPPQSRPDQASSAIGQQRNDARTSTTGDRTLATGPMAFHRPVINVSTVPQGWPTITRAHRYSNLHSAHRTFTSKALP